ncbi:MAG: DUF1549 domain-containing protein [Planctomycetes bacterium]|nr:DUF1549 domain-containing protein [Planctomycetota bacterium]
MTNLRGLALVALLGLAGFLSAGDLYNKESVKVKEAELPRPTDVKSLEVFPAKIQLRGLDDAQQLVLSAVLNDGRLQDLTPDVRYDADAKVVRVTTTGRVVPVGNGTTEVVARYGDKTIKVPVACESCDENLPINFGNQIVPIFTKLGCNGGGCHGKASGQNGFKLSLLGFEPEVDFSALVKEARGRRLFPAAPDRSLLLLKAAGGVAHGGGKRMEVGSDEYRLIRRWIAAGTPFGKPTDPTVERISVTPDHRIMTRQNKQQFAVQAHYSDGSVEDITRRAQYESNDTEIAVVDADGLVRTLALSGEAAVMVRYQSHVSVFRATVPLGVKTPDYKFAQQTVVDKYAQRKWQKLGLVPSDLCSDEQFIRRVTLDITGTLPTPKQVAGFLADKDAKKRDKLVDSLLESSEYAYYFANKWADVLRVKRRGQPDRAKGTFAFHDWIRLAMVKDKPYDEIAREILSATGDENSSPPTVWYKELQQPEQFVDDTAQVFLGLRLACAQCHHHPYEKWSQDDYWGLAAFFARVDRKQYFLPGEQNPAAQQLVIKTRSSGNVTNKRTQQPAIMKALDGEPVNAGPEVDPREKLVDWMVEPKNPFFARAVVNRYWAHCFGRGIVDPLDDMRLTNPPSNPELLDALAQDFIDHKFSLKHLVATICKSRTYQLSSLPNEFNQHDKQNYARYYPKRMSAEVLFDGVCQVTNNPANFGGLPQDKHSPNRAIMLPDEGFSSYFLDVFGRPQRISACECERVSEANLAQALHLLNSDEIQGKLSRGGGRAEQMATDKRPDAEKVKKVAYENILWALINTKEFQFNQ